MGMDLVGPTNIDCERCCHKGMKDDGGGEYEDIVPYCWICNRSLEYVKADNKPCKLKEDSYYIAIIEVNG